MAGQSRWPKPVPDRCSDCKCAQLDGLGPEGHWNGEERGGLIFAAHCCQCGVRWLGYGLGGCERLQILRWERERSA